MKKSFESAVVLRNAPSESAVARASMLGFVAELLLRSRAHSRYSLAYLTSVITPAIEQRLIKLYFGKEGQPVGFVIWAYLEPDAEERFLETGQWDLHESEWKEGDTL